jgi:hypothetical protein
MRLHASQGRASLALVTSALVLILAACSSGFSSTSTTNTATPTTSDPLLGQIAALPGYTVGLFAKGTSTYSAPDSIEVDGSHIFIGYQNNSVKDGSNNSLMSTIVEYNRDGSVAKTFSVPGHSDGMRVDPSTHLLWVTSNEDANPLLMTIDTTSGTITNYTLAPTVHGGGYDDLAFLNGKAFIVCSNPNLDANGNNVFPAVDQVTLTGTTATVTPVLMGNAQAMDSTTKTNVTLNAVDPDSLTIDWQGNLVLIDQAGNEIITIQNPGTSTQQVSRIPVGDQLDDTVWASTGQGELLVTDATLNAIFTIRTHFVVGSLNKWIFTEAPNDSGTSSFVGTVDPTTGFVTPSVIGFGKPTGLYFLPDHS